MKTQKMNLANMQGKLSRAEMKKIMAGSGGDQKCGSNCTPGSNTCPTSCACSLKDGSNNTYVCKN